MAQPETHLVICAERTIVCRSLEAAERRLAGIERLGACRLPHRIEKAR